MLLYNIAAVIFDLDLHEQNREIVQYTTSKTLESIVVAISILVSNVFSLLLVIQSVQI